MAVNIYSLPTANVSIINNTSSNATAHTDLSNGPAVVKSVVINNVANAAQNEHFKLYNSASPTVGTTAPECILFATAGQQIEYIFSNGVSFSSYVSSACTQQGGTAGVTNPTNPVNTYIQLG